MSGDFQSSRRPAGIRRGGRYFPELESLRGIAIVLVVVFHADGGLLFPFRNHDGEWPNPALAFIWAGHTGVTLFFVLSAFLLSLPFLAEAGGGAPVSRPLFYARRALRILPLYWAAVIAGTIVTSTRVADLWRGVPYLFFLESIPGLTVPMQPWSGVWWSLATEMQFYLLLPVVALAFGRSRAVTLAILAAYALAWAALAGSWLLPDIHPGLRAMSILGRGPLFLCGIGAAWLWLRHGDALRARLAASRWLAAGGADVALLGLVVALGFLLRWASFHGFMALELGPTFAWHVPEGLLWTAILLVVLLCPLRTKRLVSNRALAWLGVLSYSIYLLHQPVFRYSLRLWRAEVPHTGLGWTPLGTLWFALAMALCLLLATLTYRWIERPLLVRKAGLEGDARARADRGRLLAGTARHADRDGGAAHGEHDDGGRRHGTAREPVDAA